MNGCMRGKKKPKRITPTNFVVFTHTWARVQHTKHFPIHSRMLACKRITFVRKWGKSKKNRGNLIYLAFVLIIHLRLVFHYIWNICSLASSPFMCLLYNGKESMKGMEKECWPTASIVYITQLYTSLLVDDELKVIIHLVLSFTSDVCLAEHLNILWSWKSIQRLQMLKDGKTIKRSK